MKPELTRLANYFMANVIAFEKQQAWRYSILVSAPLLILFFSLARRMSDLENSNLAVIGLLSFGTFIITHLLLKWKVTKDRRKYGKLIDERQNELRPIEFQLNLFFLFISLGILGLIYLIG